MIRKERVRPFCQALLKVTLNRSITSTFDISLLKYILLFSFVFTIFYHLLLLQLQGVLLLLYLRTGTAIIMQNRVFFRTHELIFDDRKQRLI